MDNRLNYANTIADMLSDDYKDRIRAEYNQLCIRIDALTDYIKHNITRDTALEITLKEKQLNYMTQYKNVLEIRAGISKIDL